MEKIYELEQYFNQIVIGNVIGIPCPELKPTLESYLKKIKSASTNEEAVMRKVVSLTHSNDIIEDFTQIFEMTETEDHYYYLKWMIPVLKSTIKELNKRPRWIQIEDIIEEAKKNEIDKSRLKIALQNPEPIIIIEYKPLGDSPILVDGNHRVLSRYRRGETRVLGYVLQEDEHVEALANDLYRILYKVHWNICILLNIKTGNIPKKEGNKQLYKI